MRLIKIDSMSQSYEPQQFDPSSLRKIIIGVVALLIIVWFLFRSFITIDAGHAGLIFHTLGNGIDPEERALDQGFHMIAPWNKVIDYEVRRQEIFNEMTVLSSNLLDIKMEATIFYQPQYDNLGHLELKWGRGYKEKMIMPAMRSVVREVVAQYLPEEVNTTKRELIQKQIEDRMEEKLQNNFIQLEDVLIRNIEMPPKLRASIEKKLQQEQESLEYEFRIARAEKEKQRLEIEAEGVRKFQEIVTMSITEDLLRWKGIEATLELAKSPGAKVVVVGSGKDGLPIILGNQ